MSLTKPLRVIFAGTPEFAATALQVLIENQANKNIEIIAVYTQPDRPAGRGRQLTASPVKAVAVENGIDVYQPVNFKLEKDIDALKILDADLMIVAAYGIILPLSVLKIPRLGCINIHASILPRWRGAAPIQRAIAAGDSQTGITIMQMDEGLDTGDMLLVKTCDITAQDTGSSLHDKLATLGADAIVEALDLILENAVQAVKQDNEQACYAHKLNKEEAFINWQQPAEQTERLIRAFNSWPVAQTHFDKKVVRIWKAKKVKTTPEKKAPQEKNQEEKPPEEKIRQEKTPGEILEVTKDTIIVACGEDAIAITELQLAGAKKMLVKDLLNGRPGFFKSGQAFN